jgi:hypothetical protein
MSYQSEWIDLLAAIELITESNAVAREDAQTGLTRAISDGAIRIRARLARHSGGQTSSVTVTGNELEIPRALSAGDFDWNKSRPVKAWLVHSVDDRHKQGYWWLIDFEVFRSDIELKLLQSRAGASGPPAKSLLRKKRQSPAAVAAETAIDSLYPNGVSAQHELSNKNLVIAVEKEMKRAGLRTVSPDSILRAAGRK